MAVKQITTAEFEQEVLQHPGTVLVDFYAVWCPPCRALAPLLERFSEENADRVKVVKVDSDQDEALASQFGIRTIPTVVSFKDGQEVTRAVNPQSRAALEQLIG
jgi:thioredoxin 1